MQNISLGNCLHIKAEFFLWGIAFGKFQHWIKRSNQNIWVRSESSTPELLEFPFTRKPRTAAAPKHPDYIKMENFIYPDGGPFPLFLFPFSLRPKEIPANGKGNVTSKQILIKSMKSCRGSQLMGVPGDDGGGHQGRAVELEVNKLQKYIPEPAVLPAPSPGCLPGRIKAPLSASREICTVQTIKITGEDNCAGCCHILAGI